MFTELNVNSAEISHFTTPEHILELLLQIIYSNFQGALKVRTFSFMLFVHSTPKFCVQAWKTNAQSVLLIIFNKFLVTKQTNKQKNEHRN